MEQPLSEHGAVALPKPKVGRFRSVTSFFSLIIVVLTVWVTLINCPRPASAELDPSWCWAYGYFLKHNFQAGRDYVFTCGPLGYFYLPTYDPDLFWPSYAWELPVKLVLATSILAVLARAPGTFMKLAPCVLLGGAMVVEKPLPDCLYLLGVFSLCALLTVRTTCPPRYLVPVVVFLGLLALVKFTLLIYALSVVLFLSAQLLASRRALYALLPPAIFITTVVALWVALGQSAANLPEYLRGSLEVTAGYGPAMSVSGSPFTRLLAIGIALAIGGALFPLSVREWRGVRQTLHPRNLLLLSFLGWTGFIVWKHGFVRHDHFHEAGFFTFTIPLPFLVVALLPAYDWKLPARVGLLSAGVALSGAGLVYCLPGGVPSRVPSGRASTLASQLRERVRFVFAPNRWKELLEARRLAACESLALPRTKDRVQAAPVDLVSYEQGTLFLNGLNWKPRPVFQSYSAYTPFLTRLNAEFFRHEDAPRYVLFKLQPIDGRLPASEDGPALVELLRRYAPVLVEKSYLLLERREGPQELQESLLVQKTVRFDEKVSLDDSPERCQVVAFTIKPSRRGMVTNLALRLPFVFIHLDTASGDTLCYRVIPPMVEEGFLLNPLLIDQDDVLNFYGTSPGRRATALTITTGDTSCYEPNITLTVRTFPREEKTR